MTKTGKKYPAEVKKRAAATVIQGRKSINQAAREAEAAPNIVQKRLEKSTKRTSKITEDYFISRCSVCFLKKGLYFFFSSFSG